MVMGFLVIHFSTVDLPISSQVHGNAVALDVGEMSKVFPARWTLAASQSRNWMVSSSDSRRVGSLPPGEWVDPLLGGELGRQHGLVAPIEDLLHQHRVVVLVRESIVIGELDLPHDATPLA